jgi:hypothetical protein
VIKASGRSVTKCGDEDYVRTEGTIPGGGSASRVGWAHEGRWARHDDRAKVTESERLRAELEDLHDDACKGGYSFTELPRRSE